MLYQLHAWLADVLLVCVILHLLGAVISSVLERQNLILRMINGRKYVDAQRSDGHSHAADNR